MYKKYFCLFIAIFVTVTFTGCKTKETVSIDYGVPYTIENDKLSKYDNIVWSSDNEEIATVSGNTVTGTGEGSVIVNGVNNGKVVAVYTFDVNIVPVTGIVLSTNSTTVTVEDGFQLSYSLFPDNASDFGIKWRSADENVAVVNENGYVLAKSVGQTTISASNESGIMATCSVTVEKKSAYDSLSTDEKRFVDITLKALKNFYNSDAVTIKAVEKQGDGYKVELSGMNRLGGYTINSYYLVELDDGEALFFTWDELFGKDTGEKIDVKHDPSFDIQLINEAIDEKR